MKAYIILHKSDIICLPVTYLDSATSTDENKLQIPGYTLILCDQSSNTKRGRVCMYYRSSLPLRVGYLHECLNFKLQIGDKIYNFEVLYRSPSHSHDDFETFADNSEMTLKILTQKNDFLITTIGDFHAKSINWHNITAQKMKFSIKGFFSKCDQIRSFLIKTKQLLKLTQFTM